MNEDIKNDRALAARIKFESGDHIGAIQVGMSYAGTHNIKDANHFTEVFLNIAYALQSAGQVEAWTDFKHLFSDYLALIIGRGSTEPPIGYHNNACLMQRNVYASIYQLYEGTCKLKDVEEALQLLEFWSKFPKEAENFQDTNAKLQKMVNLIKEEKHPYYEITFNLPFSLPVPDGVYKTIVDGRHQAMSIESFQASDLNSRLGDRHFSRIAIKLKGFTSTDNFWRGPSSAAHHQDPWSTRVAISSVNFVLLAAKSLDESLRSVLATRNDIGTIETKQYYGDGEEFHFSLHLGFGGLALVDVLSKQELPPESLDRLRGRLASGDPLYLHDDLYLSALIQLEAENVVGAFYLLNSATEALIDHSSESIFTKCGALPAYESFLRGESICRVCDLFTQSTLTEPPRQAMPPSPAARIKYLKQSNVASSKEVGKLTSLLFKIRIDSMRNDLTHGRKRDIPRNSVMQAFEAYRELKSTLAKLRSIEE